MNQLKSMIREVPDFPKPGINFYDITTLLKVAGGLKAVIDGLAESNRGKGIDTVIGIEARGFIFAAPLALELNVGFVPVRKPGKLPFDTHAFHYELEYGSDTLEMHRDGIAPGQNVLLVDDLLATGGTMEAGCKLVERAGGVIVACAFLVELGFLNGRDKLAGHDVFSLLTY